MGARLPASPAGLTRFRVPRTATMPRQAPASARAPDQVRRYLTGLLEFQGRYAGALLRAYSRPGSTDPVQPALDRLGDGLETATSRFAGALWSQRRPDGLPQLRELHNAVAAHPACPRRW